MFKLAGFDSAEAKMKYLHRIKDALEALVQVIEPLRSMSVCLNMNPPKNTTLCWKQTSIASPMSKPMPSILLIRPSFEN